MFDKENGKYVELKPRYKVGEIVAVAQQYSVIDDFDIALMYSGSAGWSNKMFIKAELMPHQIKITNVRVEKLQEISDSDCTDEGILELPLDDHSRGLGCYKVGFINYKTLQQAYGALIDAVTKKGTWERNPYVFVYEFELIDVILIDKK